MRPYLLLYAFALVVRLAVAALFPDPAYPDSYYYVNVARALAATGRLEVDFIWIFAEVGGQIPSDPVLPVPSNAHWLPLSSLIQAPFIVLLGPSPLASVLPVALIGAAVAPLTLAIAREAGARVEVQAGAAVLATLPAAGALFMAQPENFAILQVIVAATLWLAARGLKGSPAAFAATGLLVGLASLARNDGFILGAAVGLLFVAERLAAHRSRRPARIAWRTAFACVGLYLVMMAPWYVRQLMVFGSVSPTTSSGYALWIRTIEEWNSITARPSLARFLEQGPGAIASSRIGGLVAAVVSFSVVFCSIVLVPFLVAGAWLRRRSIDFIPWLLYAGLVFTTAALIYPVHVPTGAFAHSAVGLTPHAYVVALEGVVALVASIGRRRGVRASSGATRLFVAAVTSFVVATSALYGGALLASWDDVRERRTAVAGALDRLGVGREERLLSLDAAGLKYFTGRGGVVTPDDPLDTIEAVARAYRARWIVLERDEAVRSLEPVLDGTARPRWIGEPVFTLDSPDGGPARIALYPVCPEPLSAARCDG